MAANAQDSMAPLSRPDKKELDDEFEDELEFSPFYGIDKSTVLQETRIFNERDCDPRKCQQVITKLLYLLCMGETLTKRESSEVFFSCTKLFQHADPHLRRLVYLVIKEVSAAPDEVIIIVSSLMKDMNGAVDLYRSNAIRVLCSIIDPALLLQIERYLKQAAVDSVPVVAAAALSSGLRLHRGSPDVIKRWAGEVQEAMSSRSPMVQYHAVALMHCIRRHDRLAVNKLVATLQRLALRSPFAQVLLVRYIAEVIRDSTAGHGGEQRPYYEALEGLLRHRSDVVILEAARAICALTDASPRELQPAITVLQLFLSSSKPVLRFAAIRTLSKVAMRHPDAVVGCNMDIEGLIADANRSISTLAITTLLKTGTESSVDRLLKQISGFMSDIGDEFKVVVVEAVRALCLKFPAKNRSLMGFLAGALREEGGFECKRAIVEAMLAIIEAVPDAKEGGLGQLCEFIEDCEFPYLCIQVLQLLGEEGPRTQQPARFIRYIYNRIILETATVRAAAVSALAKLGRTCPDLRPKVAVLLRRTLYDVDDEVRDRAAMHLKALESQDAALLAATEPRHLDLDALDQQLDAYLEGPADQPFDVAGVPTARWNPSAKSALAATAASVGGLASPGAGEGRRDGGAAQAAEEPADTQLAQAMLEVPELAAVGAVLASSAVVQLTDDELEYRISAVKHVCEAHVVLQFNCTNTVQEQVLEGVRVAVDTSGAAGLQEDFAVELPTMPLREVGRTYVVLRKEAGAVVTGRVGCVLRFTAKEVDPASGDVEEEGFLDEFPLGDLEVTPADYLRRAPVANFRNAWEGMDAATEVTDGFSLGPRGSLHEAVDAVVGVLGMRVCEGTDAVPANARSHMVLLSATLLDQARLLARVKFGIDAAGNVAMRVVSRGDTPAVSQLVHQIIQEA